MSQYIPLEVDDYHQQFTQENAPHFLLDVRTVEEFVEARIPGAINIPLDELPDRLIEVPTDHAIVVVCRSGVRSIMGAQVLRAGGLQTVMIYNLEGGTKAWVNKGWPYDSGAE
ncbi:MAG: rhodanese-like domain-containing protein [Anaerolineae bacterium]|jgi:rhodanese-related sulfurtransferase|nr:rhodanese-like domain-containing protein [Anaerolineae bacterium]